MSLNTRSTKQAALEKSNAKVCARSVSALAETQRPLFQPPEGASVPAGLLRSEGQEKG
jgi:hypothetical protein